MAARHCKRIQLRVRVRALCLEAQVLALKCQAEDMTPDDQFMATSQVIQQFRQQQAAGWTAGMSTHVVRLDMLCYDMLCHAMPCYAMLCYAMLCYAMLCSARLCSAMLCYALRCLAVPYYAMLCCDMLDWQEVRPT